MKIVFSVIIPVRTETKYLLECQQKLNQLIYKNFEVIIVTDKLSNTPNPAIKRNYGAKHALGKYLAFLDDDSYPSTNWLSNALKQFKNHPKISALCGPCLTPPADSIFQKASGLFWSSHLGSGGAGTYRNSISSQRFVDDFPSVNLIIKKRDFFKIGGFQTKHWPGEDTLLCLDITTKLHKQILYHPDIVVYHHRRSVLLPHLNQIKRYAIHRGYFAKIYPTNSRKLGYFLPSIFTIYIFSLPFLIKYPVFLLPLFAYIVLIFFTLIYLNIQKNNFLTALLTAITIPITHIYYGILFIYGFIIPYLNFQPHNIDKAKKTYLGG